MTKRLFVLLTIFNCLVSVSAQELTVKSFAPRPTDLTARTQARQDGNGVDCALVKVQLASSGATFSGNVVGDVKYNSSEYWVYMPQGSKRLTIKHEGYLPLEVNFKDYEVKPLKSKTVYVMTVSGIITSQSTDVPRIKTGWIILKTQPTGASVYINEEFVGNTPLTIYKHPYGTYSYRIEYPNYHSSIGTLELNSDKLEKTIELKPAYGSLDVTSTPHDADVIIDGKQYGKTPLSIERLLEGEHTVVVRKVGYVAEISSVKVTENEKVTITVKLKDANATTNSFNDEEEIYQVVEEMPEFPGGMDRLLEYLGMNIKYPKKAWEQGIQGRSIIEFVVNTDGSIVEPKVIRSLHPLCDEEAMRVIKAMPKWKPGKQKGKPVRVKYTVPVQFKLGVSA